MKKTLILINLLLITFIAFAGGKNLQELITKANKLYEYEKYNDAIFLYEEVLGEGYESSELYYNLGNAYFKNNNLGYAILNYEKAKLLSPNDSDIEHNMKFAETFIKDMPQKIPEFFVSKAIMQIIIYRSSNFWFYISTILFIATLATLVLFLFSKKIRYKKILFIILLFFRIK